MSKTLIHLPKDEGPHADPVEWWYVTAQGHDPDGKPYALMCALFKAGVFGLTNVYFAHWFVTDVNAERFTPQYKVFWKGMDELRFGKKDFSVVSGSSFAFQKKDGKIRFHTPDFEIVCKPIKPVMLVGGNGFVDMLTSTTHYYSYPRMQATGTVRHGAKNVAFKGLAWMDHQWSPATFNNEHAWTWFSVQLDDGTDIMCYEYGRKKRMVMVTVSWPNGKQSISRKLKLEPLSQPWEGPKSKAKYNLDWKISIPEFKIELMATPKVRNQEMSHGPFRYWEGPLRVHGKRDGKDVEGNGFLEMNGIPSGRSPFALLERLVSKKK